MPENQPPLNKYCTVLLVARRAKQLIAGAKKRVILKAENPLTIAMEELQQQKIDFNTLANEPLEFEIPAEASAEPAADETESTVTEILGEVFSGQEEQVLPEEESSKEEK